MFSRFQKYSKGKSLLKAQNLVKRNKEKDVFLVFISVFDSDQDSFLEFEELLELVGVVKRATIQKRLEGKNK